MTIKEFINAATKTFKSADFESPETEARFLICGYLDITITELILKLEEQLSQKKFSELDTLIRRRIEGEPLQYLLGKWEFMGRNFKVGPGVLIPRPETELLCEKAVSYLKNKKDATVYDLCSGSGCIGITLKKECPDIYVFLVEKSLDALEYLNYNVKKLCPKTFITITVGNVLCIESFEDHPKADLIISNPPYIKTSDIASLQKEVTFEPVMALDGGEDGLAFYRYIINNWSLYLKDDGVMMFEIGEDQGTEVSEIFKNAGFYSRITKDYNNLDRIIEGRRQPYVV